MLSSMIVTAAPDSAARRAEDNPAGPAPTTTTSLIRPNLHSRLAGDLTASAMFASVDRHPALEADSHSAQRRPRLAGHRPTKCYYARNGNCRRDHRTRRHDDLRAVHC